MSAALLSPPCVVAREPLDLARPLLRASSSRLSASVTSTIVIRLLGDDGLAGMPLGLAEAAPQESPGESVDVLICTCVWLSSMRGSCWLVPLLAAGLTMGDSTARVEWCVVTWRGGKGGT